LLVCHAVGNALHGVIRVRHHDVFGLSATQPAEVFAVAEGRLVDALVEPTLAAQHAMTARSEKAGHHPVAGVEALDLASDVLDNADELVPQHRSGIHRGVAVQDMEVGPADGTERDLDESLARAFGGRFPRY